MMCYYLNVHIISVFYIVLYTHFFKIRFYQIMGGESSVGITTRYGLDGPGIESRWVRDFPHPSRPALGLHPAPCTMGTVSFPGLKRPGRCVDHPHQIAPRLRKE